jgi:hypothetical protein
MRPIFSTRPAALLLASLGLGISPPAAAQNSDPFAAGIRWSHAASANSPWVPSGVAFAAGGELVFASGALGSPRWLLFSSPGGNGAVQPWSLAPASPTTLGSMPVRAGDQGSELFTLAQVPDPDVAHRRTEIARFDALSSAGGGLARATTDKSILFQLWKSWTFQ